LGSVLWHHFFEYDEESAPLAEATEQGANLLHLPGDAFIRMLMPSDRVLSACFEAVGIREQQDDQPFIRSLLSQMEINGTPHEVVDWKNSTCPRLCQGIMDKVMGILTQRPITPTVVASDLLTSVQMFIVQCALSTTVYFPRKADADNSSDSEQWTRLFSSTHQGISINRFETHVFNYKGPTVAIFQLNTGEVVVVANDEEWRHSCNKFGGTHAVLLKVLPVFERVDADGASIYCNFKLRSSPFGITFGRHLQIDGEMGNVQDLEVWGCSGAETLEQQRQHKQWLNKQVEKNQKVPLPGNWDENPDKSIMEMAGFQFSSERRDDKPPDEQ
jgi:hypothetical protein